MYNFAKLLTEEPEKLERLIILFLKFLMTLWITLKLFGVDISIDEILKDEVFSKHTLMSILFISFSFIVVWIGIWLIAIGTIVQLLVDFLSKICSPKKYLKPILWGLGVTDIDGMPKDNVIDFAETLDEMAKSNDDTITETATRLFQYFSVGLIIYIIFKWNNEVTIPYSLNFILIGILILLFASLVILKGCSRYLDTSLLELRKEFTNMAYSQMVNNALKTTTNRDYSIDRRIRRIFLSKKEEYLPYHPIRVTPVYVWNYNLGEKKMVDDLKKAQINLSKDDAQNHNQNIPAYNVIVTNIKPDAVKEFISKLDMGIFIYAETKNDIDNGIEEMFYKINNDNFKRLTDQINNRTDDLPKLDK